MPTLCSLPPRRAATILKLRGELAQFLRELGFYEGAEVICERRARRGAIAAFRVGGSVFALRARDAECVEIC